jgi:sugar O-acyltransferase (sialic acid O-acetyltransferase NeuD family)
MVRNLKVNKFMQKIVIIGGSNAYWEIDELIKDINSIQPTYEIVGIYDDNIALVGKDFNGVLVDGPIEKVKNCQSDVKFIFAIGSFKTRLMRSDILKRLDIPISRFETLIHPSAKIFSTAKVGNGCIIHYGTVIFNHTQIEDFCVIPANCVIGVDNLVGKGSLFGSNVTTTTNVKIGNYSFIGSSASIGENIEIEPGAHVGMGSLILKDIKAGAFVLGIPPRVLDKVEVSDEIISEWNALKNKHNKL